MSKQWDDEDDDGGEFWKEFDEEGIEEAAATVIDLNRQQEFDIAHKQLNIEVLDKAIQIAKSNRFWWWFSSYKARLRAIKIAYKRLVFLVESV